MTLSYDQYLDFARVEDLAFLPGRELRNVDCDKIFRRSLDYSSSSSSSDRVSYSRTIETAADLVIDHYEYGLFAARLWCAQLHETLPGSFTVNTRRMVDKGLKFAPEYLAFVERNARTLDAALDASADLFSFDYFGIRTLAKSYLLRVPPKDPRPIDETVSLSSATVPLVGRDSSEDLAETPQQMFMRVAVALNLYEDDQRALAGVLETYRLLSNKLYIHATPTLFHAGLQNQTLASCYLLSISEDSIESIFQTLTKCALVSKASGGVGLNVSNVRATGARIKRTNGRSGGIVPMLTVFNHVARYVDQGGGKRNGAFTIYVEPWHADIEHFIRLSRKTGVEETITRDLFTAVWCCDLFMRRVRRNEPWSLMSPERSPGLTDVFGDKFERLYTSYEDRGLYVRRVSAKRLWETILRSQLETGMPFLLHKDHVNSRDNQSHLGVIRGSNLCTEITLYNDHENVAVCNLASLSLSRFARDATDPTAACTAQCEPPTRLRDGALTINRYSDDCPVCNGGYDYASLFDTAYVATRNLDRTIDAMKYPLKETEYTNKRNRPLGIGVQGWADVLSLLRLPWESSRARTLNRRIFETIYRATLTESSMLAVRFGEYDTFAGSKTSRGILPHDAYDAWIEDFYEREAATSGDPTITSKDKQRVQEHRYVEPTSPDQDWLYKLVNDGGRRRHVLESWTDLRKRISVTGLRNSHRIAPMPTASTAQIFGNCESVEPRTSNLYYRRVQSGEFITVNRHLIDDLRSLGIWNEETKETLIRCRGSVGQLYTLPAILREVYRTVWEIPQKVLIDMTADRQPFIDQSQSLNLYMENPDFARLTRAHFYAWRHGLKTGMYYLRTRPAVEAVQFTVRPTTTNGGRICPTNDDRTRASTCRLKRSSAFVDLKNVSDSTDVFDQSRMVHGTRIVNYDEDNDNDNDNDNDDDDDGLCLSCQA